MHMLGSPKPNNGEPMRRLLIFIIPLLLSTFFLFTFSIFDGEMTGDRENRIKKRSLGLMERSMK